MPSFDMYLHLFELIVLVTSLMGLASSIPRCKFFDDPKNGYVTCDSLFRLFCSPECHPGYRFASKPAVVYMCGPVTGEWFTYPVGSVVPWPDCIPDQDSNEYDSIKHELTQKREEITKHITDTHKGIPTTPYDYTAAADPEDRFHHLFDYIAKAQRAYQYREVIEKETQALQMEHEHHTNSYQANTAIQAQTNTIKPPSVPRTATERVHAQANTASPLTTPVLKTPTEIYAQANTGSPLTTFELKTPTEIHAQTNTASPLTTSVLKTPTETHTHANTALPLATAGTKTPTETHTQANTALLQATAGTKTPTTAATLYGTSLIPKQDKIQSQGASQSSSGVGSSGLVQTSNTLVKTFTVDRKSFNNYGPRNQGGQIRSAGFSTTTPNVNSKYSTIQNTPMTHAATGFAPRYLKGTHATQESQNKAVLPTPYTQGLQVTVSRPQTFSNVKTWQPAVENVSQNRHNFQNIGPKFSGAVPGVSTANPQNLSNGKPWKPVVANTQGKDDDQIPTKFTGMTTAAQVSARTQTFSNGNTWKPVIKNVQGEQKLQNRPKFTGMITAAQVSARPQTFSKSNTWKPDIQNVQGEQTLQNRPKVSVLTPAGDDTRKINPSRSKNVLQLLTNGANKDLSNLDLHEHLRPLREAQSNSIKNATINQSIQPVHNDKAISQVNSQTTVDTSTVSMTGQRTDNDMMNQVEPIVMSESSVLNSISSLLTRKSQPKDLQTLTLSNSTSKATDIMNGHTVQSKVRGNVSPQVKNNEGKNQFQSWLTRTRNATAAQPIPSLINRNELQSDGNYQINTQTSTKIAPENSRADTVAKQQDRLFKSQLHNLKEVQSATHENFKKYPLTNQSPAQKNHVDKNLAPPKMTSSMNGPVKEHLFYFPVKKNTLIDIFKEKMQSK